jgi:hypothetical protein
MSRKIFMAFYSAQKREEKRTGAKANVEIQNDDEVRPVLTWKEDRK